MASDAFRKKKRSPTLPPGNTFYDHEVRDILGRMMDSRRKADLSTFRLARYLDHRDVREIYGCHTRLGAYELEDEDDHEHHAWRCKNLWCPFCPPSDRYAAFRNQRDYFLRLDPEPDLEARQVRLTNVVLTVPDELRAWIATHVEAGIQAMANAAHRTLAEAYGYKFGAHRHPEELWSRDMGCIMNVHAIGDEARPFPQPHPHLDVLVAGYGVSRKDGKERLVEVRKTWPEPWDHTKARWKRHLVRELAKAGLPIELQVALASRPILVVHIGKMVEGGAAEHKIWYSCRPLIDMGRASVTGPEGQEIVEYTINQENGEPPIVHETPAIQFVQSVYRLRSMLKGRQRERAYGIIRGSSHTKLMQRLGRGDEVKKRKRKLVGGYRDDGKGYTYVAPKDMHRI